MKGIIPEPPDGTPENVRGRKKGKKHSEDEEAPKPKLTPTDLEDAHRKFLFVMFGLFFLVLLVMIFFNQHFDFMSDGGI
ncbi:MAG: hypothetical protein WA705_25360 [Candidatus Ozemobacteraceae bacterium]